MKAVWRVWLVAGLLLAGCGNEQGGHSADSIAVLEAASSQTATSAEAGASLPAPSAPHREVPPTLPRNSETEARESQAESSIPPHAGWFRDPTCRNEWRWWSGLRWTAAVAGDGADGEDQLGEADVLAPPDADWPVDPCESDGIMFTNFPFSAGELGCVNPDPACVIDDNGMPRATRLVAYRELVDSGGYDPDLLQDHAPEGLPEEIVLEYLTECLSEWPSFNHQQMAYGGTPVQTCSMVWRDMAYPITYLGARNAHRCVWDAYKSYYLRGRQPSAPFMPIGWAEKCASWLDPQPHRQVLDECRLPDGYYDRLTADSRFGDYGLSFDAPELSPEAVRQRWCSLLARCNDLWRQVAPTRHARFARENWPSPCIKRVSGHEINTVRKGRCEELDILAGLVIAEGEPGLPTLPRIPAGLWLSC